MRSPTNRSYDDDGKPVKGKYALMFEEEYRRLAKHPDYQVLFKEVDVGTDATGVHNGYFSIDKKICTPFEDRELKKSATKEAVETDTYNLIMRDKERLLSFETKLKFIFSHSALREGWDNPNVFQICALREIGTERERRQTIGRGLRLCVNQSGERIRGFDVNTLTVIANEGYEEFADNLQKEIEEETGIRFGIVEEHQFAGIGVTDEKGVTKPIGFDESQTIYQHLKAQGYVDAKGKVQDALRADLKAGKVKLPEKFEEQRPQITDILRKLAGRLEIKNANDRVLIKTRQAVLESEEFRALWDRIKHKTTYRVDFDNEKLIADCTKALSEGPPIARTRVHIRKADIAIGKGGVTATETSAAQPTALDETDIDLPDLLTDLQDKTQLTRRSIVRILKESERLNDFKRNPQDFIELAAETINRTKRLALVDGIKYQRLGNEHYYAQKLFQTEELMGYLKQSLAATKSVFDRVVYDQGIEKGFAEQLEQNEAVKVYAKLPAWFKVPTPLGTYNPDWAVLIEKEGAERLYFVVETKGSLFKDDLRSKEGAKIKCGQAHFKAIMADANPARYVVATALDDVFQKAECPSV
jgi:type III restriction enzyme